MGQPTCWAAKTAKEFSTVILVFDSVGPRVRVRVRVRMRSYAEYLGQRP